MSSVDDVHSCCLGITSPADLGNTPTPCQQPVQTDRTDAVRHVQDDTEKEMSKTLSQVRQNQVSEQANEQKALLRKSQNQSKLSPDCRVKMRRPPPLPPSGAGILQGASRSKPGGKPGAQGLQEARPTRNVNTRVPNTTAGTEMCVGAFPEGQGPTQLVGSEDQ